MSRRIIRVAPSPGTAASIQLRSRRPRDVIDPHAISPVLLAQAPSEHRLGRDGRRADECGGLRLRFRCFEHNGPKKSLHREMGQEASRCRAIQRASNLAGSRRVVWSKLLSHGDKKFAHAPPPLREGGIISSRRPRERGDPYGAESRYGNEVDAFFSDQRQG
jgi:hypothetical protein